MRKLIPLLLVLMLVIPAIAGEFDGYVKALQERYSKRTSSEKVLQTWKDGCQQEYNAVFDHLTTKFDFVRGDYTTDDKVIIQGIVTTTGFCLKDRFKIRIVQVVAMVILMNKDKVPENALELERAPTMVLDGWNGRDV